MNCYYELGIVYDTPGYFGCERDKEFEDILGTQNDSSSGFHQRDMQWEFKTKEEAEAALTRLKANVDNFEFSLQHMHWDDEWMEQKLTDQEIETLMYPEEDCK